MSTQRRARPPTVAPPLEDSRSKRIIEMAREEHEDEGTLEIDDHPQISESPENGAYVAAWVWVSFADTELDKELDEARPA